MRDYTYSVRISVVLRDRLFAVTEKIRGAHTSMVMTAMETICDYVEKNKAITLPFSLILTPEFEAIKARLEKLEAENKQLKLQGLNTNAPVSRSARIGTGVIETARKRSGIKA
jgi:hypothetical protein